jgi:Spy/CpxP family protein refolding chaperone
MLGVVGPMARIQALGPAAERPAVQSNPASGSARPAGQVAAAGGNRRGPISATFEWSWWSDPDVRKELNLSDEKARKIETIFQARVKQVQPLVNDLNVELDNLNRMTEERVADESTYGLQVQKFESLNERFRESRTVMLYRMYRLLTPDQYKKLNEIRDRVFREGRGRGMGPMRAGAPGAGR